MIRGFSDDFATPILKNARPRNNLLRKVYQAAEKLVYTWKYTIKQAHRSGKCSHKVKGVVINHWDVSLSKLILVTLL